MKHVISNVGRIKLMRGADFVRKNDYGRSWKIRKRHLESNNSTRKKAVLVNILRNNHFQMETLLIKVKIRQTEFLFN